jgi:hypothetical protein
MRLSSILEQSIPFLFRAKAGTRSSLKTATIFPSSIWIFTQVQVAALIVYC